MDGVSPQSAPASLPNSVKRKYILEGKNILEEMRLGSRVIFR